MDAFVGELLEVDFVDLMVAFEEAAHALLVGLVALELVDQLDDVLLACVLDLLLLREAVPLEQRQELLLLLELLLPE